MEEFIEMRHQGLGVVARASRRAFEKVWSHKGWTLVDDVEPVTSDQGTEMQDVEQGDLYDDTETADGAEE